LHNESTTATNTTIGLVQSEKTQKTEKSEKSEKTVKNCEKTSTKQAAAKTSLTIHW
jgi:hypothetical protein